MNRKPIVMPRMGDAMSGTRTFQKTPSHLTADVPAAMRVAPSSPPIRAWLLELGMPSRQVMRFQVMAPIRAAATTTMSVSVGVDEPRTDRLGDRGPGQGAGEVRRGREQDRVLGLEGPGGDRRRDRVRRVVEAVDVVERHGQREHHEQQERHAFEHRAEA